MTSSARRSTRCRNWSGARERKTDISNALAYTNAAAAPSPTCWRRRARRLQKTVARIRPGGSIVVADHDYFDNLLNTLPDAYQALPAKASTATSSASTCATSSLKLNGKADSRCTSRSPARPRGGARRDEVLRRTQPVVIGAVGDRRDRGDRAGAHCNTTSCRSSPDRSYSAYFAEASGLTTGAAVQVSGFRVGSGLVVELDGPRVLVTFNVDKDIPLGDRTEAAIKTKSLLGAKVLEITPRGDGELAAPIPLERTTSPTNCLMP